ncbi:MAG: FAD-binding oxidoreductase [Geminicoccaceae bacterium]|nr:MAG: FAD-binding oxidoreductase [Geminicoccaceae bacterium]
MAHPFADDFQVRPYWWEAAAPEDTGDASPASVDVAIVGSGYAGLAAALELVRGGQSVALFDAGPLGIGASTRNGGLVSGGLKISKAVARRFGGEVAAAMLEEGRQTLTHLETMIEQEGLETGYRRSGRFVGAHCRSALRAQEAQVQGLTARGIRARIVPKAELRGVIGTDAFVGGMAVDDAGCLHPAMYHRALRNLVRQAGATLTPHCAVNAILREGMGFRLLHASGETTAQHVFVATNGYTGELSPWFRRRLIPLASYMIATEPLPADLIQRLSPEGRVFADTKRVLSYFRISPDGSRVLYGGRASFVDGGEVTGAAKLYRFMTRVWPELDGVELTHAWKGNVAFTFDWVPHIARHDGVVYVGGCQGSGVAMATWLGHQAARSLLGANQPSAFDRDIFPTAPLYDGRPWFLPFVGTWYQLRDALDVRLDRAG